MSRLRLALAAAVVVVAATATVVLAQGFGLTPGHTIRSGREGGAGFNDANQDFVSVNAIAGPVSFRLDDGSVVTLQGTEVTVDAFSGDGQFGGFGCWVAPSSVLSLDHSLGGQITFDSTAPGVVECPGQPAPAAISAAPAPIGLQGTVTGFTGPVIVSVALVPSGSPLDELVTTNTTCQGFTALDHLSTHNQGDTATIVVTSLTILGPPDPISGQPTQLSLAGFVPTFGLGNVLTIFEDLVVNGPATGSCGPFGG